MAVKKNQTSTAAVATIIVAMSLQELAAFGATGTFAEFAKVSDLVKQGFAEANLNMKDEAGRIAVRISEAGSAALHSSAAQPAAPEFAIDSDIPLPEVSQGRKAGEFKWAYPFPALQVGQSFLVPGATSEEQVKKLQSTVANANRRYAIPDPSGATRTKKKTGETVPKMVATRTFIGRPDAGGFRIWRKV